MKLYNAALSPNALRVRAVGNELGIDFETIDVDLASAEEKERVLRPLNPNGKVPVLVDGDFALWESRAIAVYLASLKPSPGLYPDEPRARAAIDQWSYWGAVHLGLALQRIALERFIKARFGRGAPDEAAISAEVREVPRLLGVLEAGLEGRDWIAGDLSLADFGIGTTFVYRDVAGIDLGETPRVAAWIERLEARPSWRAAAAPIEAFIRG